MWAEDSRSDDVAIGIPLMTSPERCSSYLPIEMCVNRPDSVSGENHIRKKVDPTTTWPLASPGSPAFTGCHGWRFGAGVSLNWNFR